jgi:hypothetical protein
LDPYQNKLNYSKSKIYLLIKFYIFSERKSYSRWKKYRNCDVMRRIVALFMFSTFLFFLIMGTGFGTYISSPNIPPEVPQDSTPQQLEHFTSYSELDNLLQEISNKNHKITELYNNRGRSYEDRVVWMMKISDNPETQEDDEPEVLFVGAHHGNELIANQMAIRIIETFTDNYGHDPCITWMVDTHQIWVVPMLNPDGTEYTLNVDSWRKNRSPNYISEVTPGPLDPQVYPTSYGTDLNRNYDLEWGDPGGSSVLLQRSGTYAGSAPFSELETRSMRDLVLAHNFSVYMDYHGGTELILYPWGHTPDPPPDKVLYERLGEKFTEMTGFDTVQGYELYQTNGDAIDWIYSVSGAIAFTVELSYENRPEERIVEKILDNQIKLPLYLTGISADMESGSQIEIAHIEIGNQSDLGPYPVSAFVYGIPRVSDLEVKLYYKAGHEDYVVVDMDSTSDNPNEYYGDIPTQAPNKEVRYFIAVTDGNIMVTSPDPAHQFKFIIIPSAESITTTDDIIAMIIMMIIILGFFWGGFAYTARLALIAERRKLHEYYYGED